MSKGVQKRPHGQVRRSQIVTTFGPGSMLDLPDHSVLVSGLDHWFPDGAQIDEPRLIEKLKRLLDVQSLTLREPPPDNDDPLAPPTGITAWQFPEWFVTQDVDETTQGLFRRSRLLVHRVSLTKGKFIDLDRKKRPVIPIRFVRACRRGHIDDVDWYSFVHNDFDAPCRRQLWIDETGTSGDLSDVSVRCDCEASRPIFEATMLDALPLGLCHGNRPWLGAYSRERCGEPLRLLVRSASNAYFSQKMSVISLPDLDEELKKAIDQVWEHHLQYVDTIEELQAERSRKPPVKESLDGFTDEQVIENILSRKGGGGAVDTRPVKQAEFEVLASSREEIGFDRPDGDFYARVLPRAHWDSESKLTESLDRVVLVHRLREVIAQVGFTRFESSVPDIDGELDVGVQRADLASETKWLPAIEHRGEGVFLSFRSDAIEDWLQRPSVQQRGDNLTGGFDRWKDDHQHSQRVFCGLPYAMLHTLSHLLITAVSLECGYPASSIRERIYAGQSGYGILLYTGTPDSEGTLGGLVGVGHQIRQHLQMALDLGRLCSNDPVCAHHDPASTYEQRFLQGAACHGCVLIAEPSCEQHNDFLDRALVVPTVENLGAEFFSV